MKEDKKDEEAVKVLDRMKTLCSRREYCSDDIRKKVIAALHECCPSEVVENIISELKREKYLDDLRYATAFSRDKSSIAGWGVMKIRYALNAKRIDRAVIDEALESIDAEKASGRLEKILANKYASLKGDPAWKMKLIRFSLGRGYGYDETMAVLSTLQPSS